jgi:hypothetical protein
VQQNAITGAVRYGTQVTGNATSQELSKAGQHLVGSKRIVQYVIENFQS